MTGDAIVVVWHDAHADRAGGWVLPADIDAEPYRVTSVGWRIDPKAGPRLARPVDRRRRCARPHHPHPRRHGDGGDGTVIDITAELARLVADARGHGLKSIDLLSLERLLVRADDQRRRLEQRRRDLMAVYDLLPPD
jgi:hypothetical protein